MHRLLVQRDGFQNIVRLVQDGTAGGLIDAAALHADETVLDDVQQADAVGAAQLVQVLDQLDALHLLAVHSGGDALLKVDGDVGRGVGGLLGGNAQLQEARLIVLRLQGRLLEVEALMAQVPQVLVLGVVGLTVDLQGDVVGLGVVDLLVTALDAPLTPRGDDGHIGGQRFQGQLKADLVVALAGAAVADGVGVLLLGDLSQRGSDTGTRVGGAQQVVLILGVGLQAGPDVVFDVVLLQVEDVQLGRAGLDGLLLQAVQLGALADVAGDCDDLAVVVVFLQPGNDDGGVQTAGVRQNYLFDVFLILFHDELPSLFLYQDARVCCLPFVLNIYSFIAVYYTLFYTFCKR